MVDEIATVAVEIEPQLIETDDGFTSTRAFEP